jgi:hypothetical protein
MINEIELLKMEVAALRNELDVLRNNCVTYADGTVEDIKYIHRYLKMLDDQGLSHLRLLVDSILHLHDVVGPIEQKIFPEVSEARLQLAAVMKQLSLESEKSPKKP